MSAPTELPGRVPNYERQHGEWSDIRPHGTEARARRERRHGRKPCPACRAAENAARTYRQATYRQASTSQPGPHHHDTP